ncbi:DUF4249 domain-containing protein [Flagellimonas sp. 2504JD4-2]
MTRKISFIFPIEKTIWFPVLLLILSGCVEEFTPETKNFESILVVEATLTNELKQQEIFLSRTRTFEDNLPNKEENARVRVTDDSQNEFVFTETEAGKYVSDVEFEAVAGSTYQLHITTSNGRDYVSSPALMGEALEMEDVYAERITNENNNDGMAIFVDSFDPTGNSRYYRYEYEETYRVIAPDWISGDLEGVPAPPFLIEPDCNVRISLEPRSPDLRICYPTDFPNNVIITTTNNFDEDRVQRFPVRFINRDNYIISHRYSILVRQYVVSPEAYAFFEALQDFSENESVFSDTQPGQLINNIASTADVDETVLGYFEVASVSERRIFFNYDDFFPGEALPPYADPCTRVAPTLQDREGDCVLRPLIEAETLLFLQENPELTLTRGPFIVVPRVCGDCTVLGTNKLPEFWIE